MEQIAITADIGTYYGYQEIMHVIQIGTIIGIGAPLPVVFRIHVSGIHFYHTNERC